MAKRIFMSDADIEALLGEIKEKIAKERCYGSLSVTKKIVDDDRNVTINFSQTAWLKIMALIASFDTEVQWHGLVTRTSKNEFLVYDIIVPPHTVSAATVTSDEVKYAQWIDSLEDDVFNDLRFHGHSHVNMAVSPSSTDNKYRHDIVTQLQDPSDQNDSFYIFMIINKRLEISAEVYDLTNNALYGTDDITISVITDDGNSLDEFIAEAKKVAVKEVYSGYQGGAGSSSPYSGYPYYGSNAVQQSGKEKGKSASKKNDSKSQYGYGAYGDYKHHYEDAYWDDDDYYCGR